MRKIVLAILFNASCIFSFSQADSLVARVYFAFGKADLSSSTVTELDKFIAAHTRGGKLKIEGQTDAIGTNAVNDRLSLARASEVYRYLVAKGLDTSIAHEVVGYGKRKLEITNNLPDPLNRVVVLTSYLTAATANTAEARRQASQKSFEQQIREGSSNVVLNNLNFAGGRHTLLPSAIPVLENILSTLQKHPSIEIEIQGHICCTNDSDGLDLDTNEQSLSTNRAKAVYEYLLANGISAARMSYKGFGSSKRLVYPERSEEDYSANRRVEFKIIKQ